MNNIGKILPQAVDIEENVIGALLLDKDAIVIVLEILQPESFYKEEHKEIYKACKALFARSEPIDLLTVTNELKVTGRIEYAGGVHFVNRLASMVSSAANIEYHSRIIAQKFIARKGIEHHQRMIELYYSETDDIFDTLQADQLGFNDIVDTLQRDNIQSISELQARTHAEIREANKKGGLTGLSTGQTQLDNILRGLHKDNLYILAARPGMGKTSEALCIINHIATVLNKPVGFLSLEMPASQICAALWSINSQINKERIKTENMQSGEFEAFNKTMSVFNNAPIYIDDTGGLNILQLRIILTKLKAKYKIELGVIDYLQLMRGLNKNANREQVISEISRELKALAKELHLPIIAISQLSRQVEQRGGDKRPILSDLRESGSIEQDADVVMFVYRPEYYKIYEDADGHPFPPNLGEIIVSKNRHGASDTALVEFVGHTTTFRDFNDTPFTPNFKPIYHEEEPF